MLSLLRSLIDRVQAPLAIRAVQELEAEALDAGAERSTTLRRPADDLRKKADELAVRPTQAHSCCCQSRRQCPRGTLARVAERTAVRFSCSRRHSEFWRGSAMGARKKLNGMYVVGCAVLAAFVGLVFRSWWAFGVCFRLAAGAQVVYGYIRMAPGRGTECTTRGPVARPRVYS